MDKDLQDDYYNNNNDDSYGSIDQDLQDPNYPQGISQSNSPEGSSQLMQGGSKLLEIFVPGSQGGQKMIKKVCLFSIKKEHSMKRQLSFSLFIISVFVLCLVGILIIGNILLTTYLVNKSSEDSLTTQIQSSIKDTANSHGVNTQNYLQILDNQIIKVQQIVRTKLEYKTDLYNQSNPFPLMASNQRFKYTDNWTEQYQQYEDKSEFYPKSVTYQAIEYAAGNGSYEPQSQQSIDNLNAVDTTTYFLKDIFYDINEYNIYELFYFFPEEELIVKYPGGLLYNLSTSRDLMQKYIENIEQQKDQEYKQKLHIEGPDLLDYGYAGTKEAFITLFRGIFDGQETNPNLVGIIGLRIKANDLYNKIQKHNYQSDMDQPLQFDIVLTKGQNVLSIQNNKKETVEQRFNFPNNAIKSIKANPLNELPDIKQPRNQNNEQTEVTKQEIKLNGKLSESLYIITHILFDDAFKILDNIDQEINTLFVELQLITLIAVIILCIVCILISQIFIHRKLIPFQKLTEKAKYLGGNIDKLKKHNDRMNKQMKDLDNLQAEGTIGELIVKYQQLRKGLTASTNKKQKGGKYGEDSKDLQVEYPDNHYKGEMAWEQEIELLDNYFIDQLQNQDLDHLLNIFDRFQLLNNDKDRQLVDYIRNIDKVKDKELHKKKFTELIQRGQKALLKKYLPKMKEEDQLL